MVNEPGNIERRFQSTPDMDSLEINRLSSLKDREPGTMEAASKGELASYESTLAPKVSEAMGKRGLSEVIQTASHQLIVPEDEHDGISALLHSRMDQNDNGGAVQALNSNPNLSQNPGQGPRPGLRFPNGLPAIAEDKSARYARLKEIDSDPRTTYINWSNQVAEGKPVAFFCPLIEDQQLVIRIRNLETVILSYTANIMYLAAIPSSSFSSPQEFDKVRNLLDSGSSGESHFPPLLKRNRDGRRVMEGATTHIITLGDSEDFELPLADGHSRAARDLEIEELKEFCKENLNGEAEEFAYTIPGEPGSQETIVTIEFSALPQFRDLRILETDDRWTDDQGGQLPRGTGRALEITKPNTRLFYLPPQQG